MRCHSIMRSPPHRIYENSTVQEAIDVLLENHMYSLPVVDRDEILVGIITVKQIIGLALPVSLSMKKGLQTAGFLPADTNALTERLKDSRQALVKQFMTTDIKYIYPDSPLTDALLLLYHSRIRIPVVERETKRLVGGISYTTLLRKINPQAD